MFAWWMLLPTLLAMMVALVLPGFMWLRAGVRSSLVGVGAAPAFTFGLVTVLSVAYPANGSVRASFPSSGSAPWEGQGRGA